MPVSFNEANVDKFVRLRTGGSLVRDRIASGTPLILQPFLTWLTACPIDGEAHKECHSTDCIKYSLIKILLGFLIYVFSCHSTIFLSYILYIISIAVMTSAFGLLQVGVFHYCSHGTVLKSMKANVIVGRIVSAVCLLPSFEHYRSKHMRHHSHEVLLKDEDEFTEFVIKQCDLRPGTSKKSLWFKVIIAIISPRFHCKFLMMRVLLATHHFRKLKGLIVLGGWTAVIFLLLKEGLFIDFLDFFFVPLFIPFQITVVLRTLCEHHVPDDKLGIVRDRSLADHATCPVFAGCIPPDAKIKGVSKVVSWTFWWIKMMTCHLLFRVIVLVGDAARHDLHHARPGNRNWANYMCDRYPSRRPVETFCSYESWGCFSTIDKCLQSISCACPDSESILFN